MRLLNVKTYLLEGFMSSKVPPYIILSHRWEQDEVLFADILSDQYEHKIGFTKTRYACTQALDNGLGFCGWTHVASTKYPVLSCPRLSIRCLGGTEMRQSVMRTFLMSNTQISIARSDGMR